tara:strand:- start:2745 stop:3023 length:279 start_codon:yes stop_codon:yes gene_type:complete
MKNSNNITEKSGIFYNLLSLPFIYQTVQFLLRKLNTNQRKVAKFLARRDKENFVRTSESYKNLVGPMFKVESFVVSNLLRVPYDHYVMKILK